jgi:septal ring factor EnvC (AmiA/AmiB activator)
MGDKDYQTVLIEQLVDQNKAILEYVGELPGIKKDVAELKEDVAGLRADMQVVKAAITDISHELDDHEHRIARLEAT